MAKVKLRVARNSEELADILCLPKGTAQEWEVQYKLYKDLSNAVKSVGITHTALAKRAGTSRTRVTSILNGHVDHVSSDLLIRLLGALGCSVKVTVRRPKAVKQTARRISRAKQKRAA